MMTSVKDIEKISRNAWLASLGAYAKSWDFLVGKFDETYEGSNELFNELIEKGETIQKKLEAKVETNHVLDEKIAQLRAQLGLDSNSDEKITSLSAKVDAISKAVEKLTQQRVEESATKTAEKKLTVKKIAPKKVATVKPRATKSPVSKASKTAVKTDK